MADEWISPETEAKERDYRGILEILVPASKGIIKRYGGGPYLYADLYAGPGWLEFEGRRFPGSPLIAQDILTRCGLEHEAVHFEKDPEVAERLAGALWGCRPRCLTHPIPTVHRFMSGHAKKSSRAGWPKSARSLADTASSMQTRSGTRFR